MRLLFKILLFPEEFSGLANNILLARIGSFLQCFFYGEPANLVHFMVVPGCISTGQLHEKKIDYFKIMNSPVPFFVGIPIMNGVDLFNYLACKTGLLLYLTVGGAGYVFTCFHQPLGQPPDSAAPGSDKRYLYPAAGFTKEDAAG
jgi:hypothetical protein